MQSKQYFTKIKNYPHEKSTEPEKELTWWQEVKINFGDFSLGIIFVLLFIIIWMIKKKGGSK